MSTFNPDTDQLLVSQEDRVAVLTLNRPDARNALSPELSRGLRESIAWAEADDEIGALVITGAGKAFCSGGDVKAMGQRSEAPAPSLQSQFSDLQARHRGLSGAMVQMRKPTIAALPGAAAGAGMAIALSTDLRVAADTAFLTTGYANIGLSGDYGIAWLLTRVVGPGRARELLLTGDRVNAARAEEIVALASRAPSSQNTQPWHLHLVSGEPLNRIRAGNTERNLAGVPASREIRMHRGYEGKHRERQKRIAAQLFEAMNIEWSDKDRRKDWALRGFRQFDAPHSVVITFDADLTDNDIAIFDCGASLTV